MKTFSVRRIYRIEHLESMLGPFSHFQDNEHETDTIIRSVHSPSEFPEHRLFTRKHYFGFSSVAGLHNSVIDYARLQELGFVIRIYETDKFVRYPDTQIIFRKKFAVLRETLSPVQFLLNYVYYGFL